MFAPAARLPRTVLRATVGAVLLTASLFAVSAQADSEPSGPDPRELSALATDLAQARAVRVSGASGVRVLRDVRLDATGIAAAGWGPGGRTRPALIVTRDAMPPERPEPIQWSQISRIETGRTSTLHLGSVGLVLGGMLGVVVWRTFPLGSDGGPGPGPAVVGAPALSGLALGALLGSQQYEWRTRYARGEPSRP